MAKHLPMAAGIAPACFTNRIAAHTTAAVGARPGGRHQQPADPGVRILRFQAWRAAGR